MLFIHRSAALSFLMKLPLFVICVPVVISMTEAYSFALTCTRMQGGKVISFIIVVVIVVHTKLLDLNM